MSLFNVLLFLVSLVVLRYFALFSLSWILSVRKSSPLRPRRKHCLITGGSSGLGRSIAIQLVQRGAHVSIVARRKEILEETLKELLQHANSSESDPQRCCFVVADVTDPRACKSAIETATEHIGIPVDYLFCCAGAANPGLFPGQAAAAHSSAMQLNYFGSLHIIQAAVHQMIPAKIPGKIIMISSTLGLFGLIGYSQYAPTKFALRGLAECLRQELLPYDIDVHIYYSGTILTPGFDQEQLTKPEITKIIEGTTSPSSDPTATPDYRAATLLQQLSLSTPPFSITSDWETELFRWASLGAVPRNHSVFIDDLMSFLINAVVMPFLQVITDYRIRKSKPLDQ